MWLSLKNRPIDQYGTNTNLIPIGTELEDSLTVTPKPAPGRQLELITSISHPQSHIPQASFYIIPQSLFQVPKWMFPKRFPC
jgi:hypothetical protein